MKALKRTARNMASVGLVMVGVRVLLHAWALFTEISWSEVGLLVLAFSAITVATQERIQ